MTAFDKLTPPAGEAITLEGDALRVPDHPIVPFLRGDGVGPEIWSATQQVLDAAVAKAYGGKKKIVWFEIFAGDGALAVYGEGQHLPADTLKAIRAYRLAIKGPLATPVGGGLRSLNVALRQQLDLYACVRPVRFIPGTPAPLREPQKVDVVIFRENTEDVYAGIEWPAGSLAARDLVEFVRANEMIAPDAPLSPDAAIGLKPITEHGSKRLIRRALRFALAQGRPSVTLVHKGNIMKFTEGGFNNWGYELAREEFGEFVLTEKEAEERFHGQTPPGKVVLKSRIADAMFMELILKPEEHSVVATTNLNGDYLSDAAAALVSGLGFAAGANLGDGLGVFEAVHGTAPDIACTDTVNPCSLILTGREMLAYMCWTAAADLVQRAVNNVVGRGLVTADIACYLPNVVPLRCSEFADEVVEEVGR